jgi:hypothetical protein
MSKIAVKAACLLKAYPYFRLILVKLATLLNLVAILNIPRRVSMAQVNYYYCYLTTTNRLLTILS